MSATATRRLTVLCLGIAALAGLALIVPTNPVKAEKVGVAAAVKPDAFSEGNEIKIGNSVFYNQRINTTGEGLVQVLLVDGSTFTVGPGSDLVIDKFVYDPAKKQGEVVASFSKGVLRFVGGKISKNEGGVTVNTPSGALAIRGGMLQGTPNLFSFVFGDEMKFTGKNGQVTRVYQPNYTLDLTGGVPNVRPTTAQDTAFFMKALAGGGTVVVGGAKTDKPNLTSNFFKNLTMAEITQEGTQNVINGQLDKEEQHVDNPPPPKPPSPPDDGGGPGDPQGEVTVNGYAAGIFVQTSGDSDPLRDSGESDPLRVGGLSSHDPSDVALAFDGEDSLSANLNLFVDFELRPDGLKVGDDGNDKGGASLVFGEPSQVTDSEHFFASLDPSQTKVYGDTTDQENENTLNSAVGVLVSSGAFADALNSSPGENSSTALIQANQVQGPGDIGDITLPDTDLCEGCSFVKWGAWLAYLNFQDTGDNSDNYEVTRKVTAFGWWVAGDVVSQDDLPTDGSASYAGRAVAWVANNRAGQQAIYPAKGNMDMNWDFGKRLGDLKISKFDMAHIEGGLTFAGPMCAPGVGCGTAFGNHFGGPLTVKMTDNLPNDLQSVRGSAIGSFVNNGNLNAAGVIGNWGVSNRGVSNNHYSATGIFAGSKN